MGRVKSGNYEHQVNSDKHLQTVEIQMRRLLMSRLIRIFTVCLVNLFFIPIIKIGNKQGRCPNLADRPNLPDFTLFIVGACTFVISTKIYCTHNWHIFVVLQYENLRHSQHPSYAPYQPAQSGKRIKEACIWVNSHCFKCSPRGTQIFIG